MYIRPKISQEPRLLRFRQRKGLFCSLEDLALTLSQTISAARNGTDLIIPTNKAVHPFLYLVCTRLASLVRSLTANQEVPGSFPGLVEG